jgi:hypothetical protein
LTQAGDIKNYDDNADIDPDPDSAGLFTIMTGKWDTPAMNPSAGSETFEAIVYAATDQGCNLNLYVGATSGAELTAPGGSNATSSTYQVNELNLVLNGSPSNLTAVEIKMNTNDFDLLPDDMYEEINEGSTDDKVGKLHMCVELQQHACGVKQDFAYVLLEFTFALEDNCIECPIAYVSKEGPDNDEDNVGSPGLECYIPGDNNAFTQGDSITICLKYPDNYKGSACFDTVTSLLADLNGGPSGFGNTQDVDLLNLASEPGWTQVGETNCKDIGEKITGTYKSRQGGHRTSHALYGTTRRATIVVNTHTPFPTVNSFLRMLRRIRPGTDPHPGD